MNKYDICGFDKYEELSNIHGDYEDFYVIIEKATGIEWVRSEDIEEIKKIYNNIDKNKEVFRNFKKEDFILENNRGVIIYE